MFVSIEKLWPSQVGISPIPVFAVALRDNLKLYSGQFKYIPSRLVCNDIPIKHDILKIYKLLHLLWKEGNVLFNDTFNTFYLRLYGI